MCGQFQDSESSMKVDESANIRKWIASHDSRERGHALEAKKSGSVSWLWFEW